MISCVCALGSHVASFLQAFWQITWVYYHHVCHTSSALHLPWFGHPNVGSKVQVMQLLILSILKISLLLASVVLLSSLLLFTCSLWISQGKRWSFYTYVWHLVISTIGFSGAEKWNIPYWIPLMQSAVLQWCNFDFLFLFQNTNFATFSSLSVHSLNSYGGRHPSFHCIGGCMDHRASLDALEEGKISCHCQESTYDCMVEQPIA